MVKTATEERIYAFFRDRSRREKGSDIRETFGRFPEPCLPWDSPIDAVLARSCLSKISENSVNVAYNINTVRRLAEILVWTSGIQAPPMPLSVQLGYNRYFVAFRYPNITDLAGLAWNVYERDRNFQKVVFVPRDDSLFLIGSREAVTQVVTVFNAGYNSCSMFFEWNKQSRT